jgi:serine phosphatase RsbU (regulator of sigma subunit)
MSNAHLMSAPKPPNEVARLAALREYDILDTDPEIGFDDLTLLASSICDVPISAITLIDTDRQWFKSRVGLEAAETPLEYSFCAYAILRSDMLIVEDAAQDASFALHPAVTQENGIRFYAGAQLVTPEGFALGTICVADHVPRHLTPEQYRALQALGRQVQTQLELRRKLRDLRRTSAERDRVAAEKATQAAEIERDLQFARQFQQSLLPNSAHYPSVPNAPSAPMRLKFHHIYQPALSLGGDFFDVIKLSEKRAGIFIADVMGHGARSALVTAILRTLFQELALQISDPGELLTHLNARFHRVVEGSSQFLFVSACYLIVDTEQAEVHFSSAGHPAPVWADSLRQKVVPLEDVRCTNAALGLTSDSVYGSCTFALSMGDTFLLFTDGLVEAPTASGEEFGEERLYALIRENPEVDASSLTSIVVDALNQWTGAVTLPDDLCLVVVQAMCDISPDTATKAAP